MPSQIRHVTVDCADPYALAQFWCEVTGWTLGADDNPGDPEAEAAPPAGSGATALLFIRVPEGKSVKNRVHLDIAPTGRSRDEEVERLVALGATVIDRRVTDTGAGWVVMGDPEGNEFCVERSAAERAAQQ
jgi:predicted enzyme related to lactoylglutathione lyase